MAHHEKQATAIESVLELLSEHGLGRMAEAMQTLLNEAMKLERSEFLRAAPGERTDERTGYANGFKPKTFNSRLGRLELQVPQTRDVEFYPSVLERGERSERALKLGLEWLYRLCKEPGRLWKRYLKTNSVFAFLFIRRLLVGR